jgi:hypothetical protein
VLPPPSSAIDAAFAANLLDWFNPDSVAMLRRQVCEWIATAKTTGGSGGNTGAARPPMEPHYLGACWVALIASREMVDPKAAIQGLQRRH